MAEGDKLASIGDPLGDQEVAVRSPADGIVIGWSNLPLAQEGDALFNVAACKSRARAEDAVEELATANET